MTQMAFLMLETLYIAV